MALDLKELERKNYVRKGGASDYFFDLNKNMVDGYKNKFGEDFNIIIHNIEENPLNYYIIPYSIIKYILTDENLNQSTGRNRAQRWIGVIKHHQLQIRNCPVYIDLSVYYGNPLILNHEKISNRELESIENEYAIENKRAEIMVRVKQSVFRKKVLDNFSGKCCLTTIKEPELLLASHIVPWSDKVESRLDPSNGLCLFASFDKLFDQGFISFTNTLKVIITPKFSDCSIPLQSLLLTLKDKSALQPKKHAIKNEYLEYHRDIVFKK